MKMNFATALIFAFLLWNVIPLNSSAHEAAGVNLVPVEFSQLSRPALLAANHRFLYIFDDSSNRLAIVEQQRHTVKLVGSIGTDLGQFFHPDAMVASDQEVIFLDNINNRLQFFNSDGDPLSECYFASHVNSRTLALMDNGTLLLNDPQAGSFITAVDRHCKVLYSAGQPTTLSALYSESLSNRNEGYRRAANYVWIATDHENNIYVSHLIAPVITKYSPAGKILWSRKLEDRENQFRSYSPAKGGMSTSMDGVQFPIMTKSIIVDNKGHVLILSAIDLFSKDRITALSNQGQILWSIDVEVPKGALFTMTKQTNDIFVSTVFMHGVYRVEHHP